MTQAAVDTNRIPAETNTLQGPRRPPVTADKEAVIAMLEAEGMTPKAIAATLGLSIGTVYNTHTRMKKNGQNALLTPKRIKTATKVIDTFMRGERIGVVEEIDPVTGEIKVIDPGVKPKCSTIKACADTVLDRAYPKAQEDMGKGSVSFTQINIALAAPNPPITVLGDSGQTYTDNDGR